MKSAISWVEGDGGDHLVSLRGFVDLVCFSCGYWERKNEHFYPEQSLAWVIVVA